MKALGLALRSAWKQTKDGFLSLSGSPRDLYVIFAVKVLESYNYFSLSRSITLYLTEEFGIDDYRAGTLYGLWGTLLTAYGFLLGGAIDTLGVKLSLLICFLLNISSRIIMASTNSSWMMLAMLLGPNAAAGALGVPVMTIGVKRYTNERNRGFSFALFYSLMNGAALVQGLLMDVFRVKLKHGFNLPSAGEHSLLNSGFRLFLASGCLTSLAGLVLILTLLPSPGKSLAQAAPASRRKQDTNLGRQDGVEERDQGERRVSSPEQPLLLPSEPRSTSSNVEIEAGAAAAPPRRVMSAEETLLELPSASGVSEVLGSVVAPRKGPHHLATGTADDEAHAAGGDATPSKSKPRGRMATMLEPVKALLLSRGFYKFMFMSFLTVNLKSIFRHLDATVTVMPTAAPELAPKIFMTCLPPAFVQLPKYQLRSFGCDAPIGLIYSINPAMIVLLVPVVGAMTTGYQPFDMIHLGGYISALSPFFMVAFDTEWATAAFVALLSLGEAIWSPRWYDYSMSVAPEGREGLMSAMSSAPLFVAQLPTGMISGALLAKYCPDNGQCAESSDGEPGPGRRLLAAVAPGVAECNGRVLWLIVGAITLSSPLLILTTQRWIRPDPQDFAKMGLLPTHRHRTETEGDHFDVNEADPTVLVENVFQARNEAVLGAGSDGREDAVAAEGRPLLAINHVQ